jgi:hypothetical protein
MAIQSLLTDTDTILPLTHYLQKKSVCKLEIDPKIGSKTNQFTILKMLCESLSEPFRGKRF